MMIFPRLMGCVRTGAAPLLIQFWNVLREIPYSAQNSVIDLPAFFVLFGTVCGMCGLIARESHRLHVGTIRHFLIARQFCAVEKRCFQLLPTAKLPFGWKVSW